MRRTLLLGVLLAPLAFAQWEPPAGPPSGPPPPGEQGGPIGPQLQKRMRLMMVVELSETLGLDDAQALKLRDTRERFDALRAPIHREVREQVQILRRAADGDASAYPQVDAAIARVGQLREKLHQLDRQRYLALAQGLSPQKRARLALALARLHGRMLELAHEKESSGG